MSKVTLLDNCQSCAECCKWQNILVKDEEIKAIEKKLNMEVEEFSSQQYFECLTKTIHYRILKHKSNGHCIFLETDEKKYSCKIYEFRPKICVEYPSNKEQFRWCEEHIPIIPR